MDNRLAARAFIQRCFVVVESQVNDSLGRRTWVLAVVQTEKDLGKCIGYSGDFVKARFSGLNNVEDPTSIGFDHAIGPLTVALVYDVVYNARDSRDQTVSKTSNDIVHTVATVDGALGRNQIAGGPYLCNAETNHFISK